MDDAMLVSGLLSGDARSVHYFFQTYKPYLAKLIRSKVKDPHDADEVLQDTLFAFLEAVRDYAGKSTVKTFLYAICSRKIVDFYRRKKVKHFIFSHYPGLEEIVSPLLSPEAAYESQALKTRIDRALNRLVPRYKKILLYKYIDNRTSQEIARQLETSVKSIEMVLFRARKAFIKSFVSI